MDEEIIFDPTIDDLIEKKKDVLLEIEDDYDHSKQQEEEIEEMERVAYQNEELNNN